jgi:putative ABC transport system permease protein
MGFNRTVDHAFANAALTGDPYDVVAAPNRGENAAVARALDTNRDVTSWFTTTERHGVIGDSSYLVRALGGDVAHSGYVVESGRLPRTPTEGIAGYGFLQQTGKHVGDDVTFRFGDRPLAFRIVGWYSDTEDTGQVLMVTLGGLRRVEPHAGAEAFFGHVRPGVSPARVVASLQAALQGKAQLTTNKVASNDEIDAFNHTFWIFTSFVLVVAFANLASTLLLAVRERMRDLGVLRSVGFTPRQVLNVSAIGAGALALVAAIVGVPAGWGLYRLLIKAVGTGAGIGPSFGADPALLAIAALFPLAIAAAALLGASVTRRAATAEVSDLVRYE